METKSLKELLQLILEKGNKSFKNEGHHGLCTFNGCLYHANDINTDEYYILRIYIKSNRPPKGSKHYKRPILFNSGYYWKPKAWAPRQKWLEDQIKNLK